MTPAHRRQIDALTARFKALPGQLDRRILPSAIRDQAAALRRRIVAATPVGETGKLRRAIEVEPGTGKDGRVVFRVVIGGRYFVGKQFYGAFVEFGTRKMRARKFIRRTLDRERGPASRRIESTVRSLVERQLTL